MEAELVVDLVNRLRAQGYLVRLELQVPTPEGGSDVRADIAVWSDPVKPPFLIEVKRDYESAFRGNNAIHRGNRRQRNAYENTGLPFRYCLGPSEVDATLQAVDDWRDSDRIAA